MSRRADSDLSSSSLADLEGELDRVDDEIRGAGSSLGTATAETEARAIRKIAVLSGHRRLLLIEIRHRRAAIAASLVGVGPPRSHQFPGLFGGVRVLAGYRELVSHRAAFPLWWRRRQPWVRVRRRPARPGLSLMGGGL